MRTISPVHGTGCLKILLHVDDILMLSINKNELEDIMHIYFQAFKRFGWTISADKTTTMACNATGDIASRPSIISINEEEVDNVRSSVTLDM